MIETSSAVKYFLRLALLITLAVALALVAPSAADEADASPHSTLASSGETAPSSQHVLARGPDGTLYLAYLKRIDGYDQVVVAQSQDDGRSWSRTDQVSSGSTHSTNRDLTVDRQGRVHLVWTKYARLGDAEEADAEEPMRQIFASVYDGSDWSHQRQLTHDEYHGVPSAAVDSQGRVHIVWYGFDGQAYQVYHRYWDHGEWSKAERVSQGYPDSVNPAIAVDGDDNLHVAWYKFTRESRSYQVAYRRYRAATGRWALQRQLSQDLFTATDVSLAVARDGRVFVAYEGNPEPNRYGLYARVYDADGDDSGHWRRQATIVPPERDAIEPSMAVDAQGRAFVVYRDRSDGAIYAVRHEAEQWRTSRPIAESESGERPNVRWGFHQAPVRHNLDLAWMERNARRQDATNAHLIHFRRIPLP